MRIIGIHDGHNAAACLLEDGVIRAAVQEERLTRIKNHDVFPAQAVAWLLREAGCGWEGIDAVAMNGLHMPVHRDRAQLIAATRHGGDLTPGRMLRRMARATPLLDVWKRKRRKAREAEAAAAGVDPGKLVYIDHHACHAAAAYWGECVSRRAGAGPDGGRRGGRPLRDGEHGRRGGQADAAGERAGVGLAGDDLSDDHDAAGDGAQRARIQADGHGALRAAGGGRGSGGDLRGDVRVEPGQSAGLAAAQGRAEYLLYL